MCGELIGMGQNCPVQRPPLSLTFCGKRFTTTQTSTFAEVLSCTVTLRNHHCLIFGSEHISCSNATSCNKTDFILSKVCLLHTLKCLDFHDYPSNENRGEELKNNKNSNAPDDQRLAANKAQPISIKFL